MNAYSIIILDSHPGAAFVTQRSLELELDDATTTLVGSPNAAWEACLTPETSLLIIDPTDYGEAAWLLLRLLRESRPELPIMILAARCTPRVRLRAAEAGVICMPKTHEMGEICSTVRHLLGAPERISPSPAETTIRSIFRHNVLPGTS